MPDGELDMERFKSSQFYPRFAKSATERDEQLGFRMAQGS
jgi:hypothetical protein